MSPYLVLLILEFFLAQLATLPYELDSNVTQLLANMLTKPSVFYYLPVVSCNLISIKLLLLLKYNNNKQNMGIFYKKWKKYNGIQLTKSKMDINIRKMANHPPST